MGSQADRWVTCLISSLLCLVVTGVGNGVDEFFVVHVWPYMQPRGT